MADNRLLMSWRPSPAFARDGRSPGTAARRIVWWSRPPPWSEAVTGTRIGHPGRVRGWAVEAQVTRGSLAQRADPARGVLESSRDRPEGHTLARTREGSTRRVG